MKNIFVNSSEKRLRTGWRILFFLFTFWAFASLIFLIKPLFGEITKREYIQNYSLIIVSILALGASISVPLARKIFDKRPFISLGLKVSKQSFQDIFFGFLLSALMAALFFSGMLALGFVEFNGFNLDNSNAITEQSFNFVHYMSVISIGSILLLLLEYILVGYWEELVFRGYLLQNMADGLGIKTAIIISCLIYGLIHITNPNAGLLSSSIIVLFGFLRIYGYLATKMLWLSIGMHIGWNFFQGPIFGFAASGYKKATLIKNTITSNKEYLTGGEFGPEGSLLIIPILILALYIMRWYAKKYYPTINYLKPNPKG
ncbi:MAG: CPBP family intramembrane metalloprotease [Melioribacteraceae bacterium]|nr:CPBP family intramembrane metalloprotease [Melioribacteraceae bacterium]